MADFEINDRRMYPRDGVIKEEEEREAARAQRPAEPPRPQDDAKEGAGAREEAKGPPRAEASDGPRKDPEPSGHAGQGEAFKGPGPGQGPEAPGGDDMDLEVSFSTLVIGLGSTALIHMGEAPPGSGPPPPKNLKEAKHVIDLLGVLQQKTEGNLTEAESQLLKAFLFDLRMKYVQNAKKGGGA
jgi:hypothetical protein